MTRIITLILLLYTIPGWAQSSLVIEGITLNNEDRTFFASEIISATSATKPVLILGTSKVAFQAVNRIYMGPGFSTSNLTGDARFHAYIDNTLNTIDNVYPSPHNLLIAPNPSNGYFTLTVQNERIQQLLVTDVLGREVYEKQAILSDQEDLHLENLPEGFYFVRVITNNYSYVSKIKKK